MSGAIEICRSSRSASFYLSHELIGTAMRPRVSRNRDNKSPAIGSRVHMESWFWAIVFVSSFIVAAFPKLNSVVTPADEFVVFNIAWLEQFAKHPARYKVILLGDSRLKYAILPDEGLANLSAQSKADIAFLRIVQNQAQFSDFEPFLDDMLRTQPDLVVLQGPLLFRHRDDDLDLRSLQKLMAWALGDGDGTFNPAGVDQRELQFGTPLCGIGVRPIAAEMSNQRFDALVREVKDRGTPDTDGPNAAAARAFIASAEKQDTNVVILNLPATPSYFRIFAEAFPDYAAAPIERRAATWEYPDQFPMHDYCDLMHLDADARATFSEWFASQAVRELEDLAETLKLARSAEKGIE